MKIKFNLQSFTSITKLRSGQSSDTASVHRLLPDSSSGRSSSWYHLDCRRAGRPCPGANLNWWCDPVARFPTKSFPSACPKTESVCRNDRKWCWSLHEEIIRSIKHRRNIFHSRAFQIYLFRFVFTFFSSITRSHLCEKNHLKEERTKIVEKKSKIFLKIMLSIFPPDTS